MYNLSNESTDKHICYLDTARGIAALMVFAMHFFEHKYYGRMMNNYLSILCNGRDAVSFFFVLSGFVLSYKYVILKKPLHLQCFFISRFFRLWPAFFIIIVVSCLYAFNRNHLLAVKTIADIFIFNREGFWEEAFMLRFHNNFYGAGWTLTIEMVGSMLLPFYILIAVKDKRLIPWLIFAFLAIAGSNFFAATHFLLGLLVCCYYPQINPESFRSKKWFMFRYPIVFLAIILWPIRFYDAIFSFGPMYKYLADFAGIDFGIYTAVSSAIFLVTILYNKKIQHFLENRLLVFIGKISFSIYLVHVTALNVVYDVVEKSIPSKNPNVVLMSMVLCYIILTFLFSVTLHYCVELPLMRIGKRVVNKMKPSVIVVNEP